MGSVIVFVTFMKSHFNEKTKVHSTLQELKEYAPELKLFTHYKRFLK